MNFMKGRRASRPEVQMSPLIDVIFLLLIFYAVTTQFVNDQRLKLNLPEAKTAEDVGAGSETRPPVVKVAVDGTIWIGETEISEQDLEAEIRRLVENGEDQSVILQGDEGADYGVVVHVLDVARSVGATSIQMSADRPQKEQ